MNLKKYFKVLQIGDKILLAGIILFSLLGIMFPYLYPPGALSSAEVVISVQGQEKARMQMGNIPAEGLEVEVAGPIGIHRVIITEEGVRVIAPEKDPLKICEKTGWIKRPGPMIICVPNELAIWLESDEAAELDGITE